MPQVMNPTRWKKENWTEALVARHIERFLYKVLPNTHPPSNQLPIRSPEPTSPSTRPPTHQWTSQAYDARTSSQSASQLVSLVLLLLCIFSLLQERSSWGQWYEQRGVIVQVACVDIP